MSNFFIKSKFFNANNRQKLVEICKKIWNFIYEFGAKIGEHKLFILAGGIAFNVLLYIIPLILIFVYFINIFIDEKQLIKIIQETLLNYLPNTDFYSGIIADIIVEIQRIADSSKVAGIVGFVILLWISSTIISTLNTCISMIFNVVQPDYFKTKLKDLGTTILLNFLILIYCVLIPIFSIGISILHNIFPDFLSEYVSQATLTITHLVISFILFYFIYWIIPSNKTKIHHKIAYQATLIAVFATELARNIFTWYISTISNYSRFYGTYAVLVTMAIWLYYSCFIILFSAELAQFIGNRKILKLASLETNTVKQKSLKPANSKVSKKKR